MSKREEFNQKIRDLYEKGNIRKMLIGSGGGAYSKFTTISSPISAGAFVPGGGRQPSSTHQYEANVYMWGQSGYAVAKQLLIALMDGKGQKSIVDKLLDDAPKDAFTKKELSTLSEITNTSCRLKILEDYTKKKDYLSDDSIKTLGLAQQTSLWKIYLKGLEGEKVVFQIGTNSTFDIGSVLESGKYTTDAHKAICEENMPKIMIKKDGVISRFDSKGKWLSPKSKILVGVNLGVQKSKMSIYMNLESILLVDVATTSSGTPTPISEDEAIAVFEDEDVEETTIQNVVVEDEEETDEED